MSQQITLTIDPEIELSADALRRIASRLSQSDVLEKALRSETRRARTSAPQGAQS